MTDNVINPPKPPPFNHVKQCRHGLTLYNVNDFAIGLAFHLYGEFSEGEIDLFKQIVRPGDIVFDVGANIGAHTLYFSEGVGPTGHVLAYEPQRFAFQALCANMALNSITNVRCFNCAVGESEGSIQVPVLNPYQRNNFGALPLDQGQQGEAVPLVRLDTFNVPHCRLMKIDVEGMELSVLKGAAELIKKFRPVLYVENDRPEKSGDLVRYIESIGYGQYWHLPPHYNPNNFFKNPENVYSWWYAGNMLCVPREQTFNLDGFKPVPIPAPGEPGPIAEPPPGAVQAVADSKVQ